MHFKKYYILLFLFVANITLANPIDSLKIDKNTTLIKRHFPSDFKAKYDNAQFVYEYNAEAATLSWWDRFKRWLAEKLLNYFRSSKEAGNFVSILFKTLYILAILLVVYFIAKALINKEGNWIFGRKSSALGVDTEQLEKQLLETNFDSLIAKAVAKADYRLAIRYHYLKTLKLLAKKNIIQWEFEKTNRDYYYEIANKATKEQFAYISYIYNYSWYGEFEVNDTIYNDANSAFQKLFKLIS